MKASPPLCSTGKAVHTHFPLQWTLGSPSPREALKKEHQFSREVEATGSHWSQVQGSECCLQDEMWALGSGSSQTEAADITSSTFPEHRKLGDFVCLQILPLWPSCPRTSIGFPGRGANNPIDSAEAPTPNHSSLWLSEE